MKIIYTIDKSADFIMKKDAQLLDELKSEPILHFYKWKSDSLTYGYFVDIKKYVDLNKAKEKKLSLGKRPTGGGIVFHLWDLAFSFFMPSCSKNFFKNPLDNYKFVNSIVLEAVIKYLKDGYLLNDEINNNYQNSNFCMAKPTKYDLIYKGKKIAGASQRKKQKGYLHQSSICLTPCDLSYIKNILIDKEVANMIFLNSSPIFLTDNIEEKRKIIIENLIKSFEKRIS